MLGTTYPATDELLEAQCGQIWELKMPEGQVISWPPNFHEFFYQEPCQVLLILKTEEKSYSSKRRGKVSIKKKKKKNSQSNFVFNYSYFKLLCQFMLYCKVNQPYVCVYISLFRYLSHLGHHKVPSRGPWATQ